MSVDCSRGLPIPNFKCVIRNKTDQKIDLFYVAEAVGFNDVGVKVFTTDWLEKLDANSAVELHMAYPQELFSASKIIIRPKQK